MKEEKGMDKLAWLKLQHGCNANKLALIIWKESEITIRDKFEAVCGICVPEFKEIEHEIVIKFMTRLLNEKKQLPIIQRLQDIPAELVVVEDLVPFDIKYDWLERAIYKSIAKENILQEILKAHQILSDDEINLIVKQTLLQLEVVR